MLNGGMNEKRILVGLSGGVDSAVAAALLMEQGFLVSAVTLRLFPEADGGAGDEAAAAAADVAVRLGIEHRVLDRREKFERCVVTDFVAEYIRGRTPNPCLRCNPLVKLAALLEAAERAGFPLVATGHYARVARAPDSSGFRLRPGADPAKDQSYFLYRLSQSQLSRLRLPVGEITKAEVRERARALRLPAADRAESREICFIPDGDYAGFLRKRAPGAFRPGPILDLEGKRIGGHEGIVHFTIGQRRGLGIAAPRPLYVVEIRPGDDAVVAGPVEALYRIALEAVDPHWISGEAPGFPFRARARIRYRHAAAPAEVESAGEGRLRVRFIRPQRAAAPGQAVVFMRGDDVIGGAVIDTVGTGKGEETP